MEGTCSHASELSRLHIIGFSWENLRENDGD
jgi:hypothetical protein